MMPTITNFEPSKFLTKEKTWLFVAEGFEERSLSFLKQLPRQCKFDQIVVFVNQPSRETRLNELEKLASRLSSSPIFYVNYLRDSPEETEREIREILDKASKDISQVVVDISVFSRLLIMILFGQLVKFPCKVEVVYSEPMEYSPTKEEFVEWMNTTLTELGAFSSEGLRGVLRTSGLSSSIMTGSPIALIAFTSFNSHLIGGLLRSLSPARLILIGVEPPRLVWRGKGAADLHKSIWEDYPKDNPINGDGQLLRRSCSLDYRETISALSDLYKEFCFTHRIILAPTGSKMQTIGTSIFRSICTDVHIEYPMPERYFATDYSSDDIHQIHHLDFGEFSKSVHLVSKGFGLDGSW